MIYTNLNTHIGSRLVVNQYTYRFYSNIYMITWYKNFIVIFRAGNKDVHKIEPTVFEIEVNPGT